MTVASARVVDGPATLGQAARTSRFGDPRRADDLPRTLTLIASTGPARPNEWTSSCADAGQANSWREGTSGELEASKNSSLLRNAQPSEGEEAVEADGPG